MTNSFSPELVLHPWAYLKLQYMLHACEQEIGGLGFCPNAPLYVEDIAILPQTAASTLSELDDEGRENYAIEMCGRGYKHTQFQRVWFHTHPSGICSPSHQDEDTFKRIFAGAGFGVMAIASKCGWHYAELRTGTEIVLRQEIPFKIDWPEWARVVESEDDKQTRIRSWNEELHKNVTFEVFSPLKKTTYDNPEPQSKPVELSEDYLDYLESYTELLDSEDQAVVRREMEQIDAEYWRENGGYRTYSDYQNRRHSR